MIVDDDLEIRSLSSAALDVEGYQVVALENCSEALKKLETQQIDLGVLDIQFKQESGLDLLRILVEEHPRLSGILCSAYAYYKTNHASWHADAYIDKNSSLEELKEKSGIFLARTTGVVENSVLMTEKFWKPF